MLGVFTCGLLGVLMGAMGVVCDCMLENYTLLIEKHGCDQCMAVNTTICSGFCHSQDTNVKGRVGKSYLIQQGCMPHTLAYRAAHVPGCQQNISSLLYYPESRSCHCARCDGHTHHCVHRRQAHPIPSSCPFRQPARRNRTRAGKRSRPSKN
ncbi:thyrotropin subunit beta-like [Osmerus eperlanus]|uniref:thyrotropin subunit beta-like n=1 Tax=Osmerus eperlanus TaxID=29151 RepID=UPI002E110915